MEFEKKILTFLCVGRCLVLARSKFRRGVNKFQAWMAKYFSLRNDEESRLMLSRFMLSAAYCDWISKVPFAKSYETKIITNFYTFKSIPLCQKSSKNRLE